MNVIVRYFAAFREATGLETEKVDTRAGTTGELFAERQEQHSGLQRYSASPPQINDETAQWDSAITEGDEILFFPPVAGG